MFKYLFLGLTFVVGLLFTQTVKAAQDNPVFSFPVDCVIGKTCWIPNYVDLKPGKGVLDYACGHATYDAKPGDQHKGTDIAVQDLTAVRNVVLVYAAADGVVQNWRDGIDDIDVRDRQKALSSAMFCGNAVRLKHKNGYVTQYCHMKKGSVFARKGERVRRGDVIGHVGLSGQTMFPHLHFEITKDGKVVDPFAGINRKAKCGVGEHPLWDKATLAKTPYQPTAIYNMGFSFERPDFKNIAKGLYKAKQASTHAPALVVWAEMFRLKAKDRIQINLIDPTGKIIVKSKVSPLKSDKASYTAFSGKHPVGGKWQPGVYTGQIKLMRSKQIFVKTQKIDIR